MKNAVGGGVEPPRGS